MKKGFEAIKNNRNFGLLAGFAVILIAARILTPRMYSVNSIMNMLRNYSIYAFLSAGMMLVIITGGIDLSIGSTLSLVGVICSFGLIVHPGIPGIVWLFLGMLIGLVCGLVNGFLVGYLKIVPMIATLGTMYIYRGMSFLLSGGAWCFPQHYTESYTNIALRKIAGVNSIIWIAIIVFVLLGIFMEFTTGGRRIYAVGTNEESARIAGINKARVLLLAYGLEGMLAGVAGMLYTSNYALCFYGMGEGYEMTAIAICILGGVSIRGGRGKTDSVALACVLMSVITYFISLLPGLSVYQNVLQAVIIAGSVGINNYVSHLGRLSALRRKGELM